PEGELQIINLFPIAVGGEVRSALAVGDKLNGADEKRRLAHFCRTVASELEILRLREELSRRILLTRAGQKFNENLKKIDTEDFWLNLTQISAELLRAERASLLIYDEKANRLQPKSLIGVVGDLAGQTIGERVALNVLQSGKSLVVANITETDTAAAPLDWQYKTNSFISYPIMIGERKIAVLNFTDRADRAGFNDFDLELLQAISPQIAVAIDRASLKDKAGEFEQLSVTDALTGLLNRRYMEVRLAEEIKRSNRDGYPMSFLMIDVDDFGRFNKDFGVLIGDDALRQTVKAMTSTLRGADVAARYGGEEFCILLPQTTLSEAFSIGERIRQSVEKIDFPQRPITVSIGITTFSPDVSTPDTIIKTADEALRQAKEKGKNNVQIYESSVFKQ
ncbi:MAG TPA: sensor domain-containing diguanylate cyclase, partial [Pyrinomonadaceae bacterium]